MRSRITHFHSLEMVLKSFGQAYPTMLSKFHHPKIQTQLWHSSTSLILVVGPTQKSYPELSVTDLVSRLSSRAALRQLAPRMLLSQPSTRLASYTLLLPSAWKQRELERKLGERNSLLKEELCTMLRGALKA